MAVLSVSARGWSLSFDARIAILREIISAIGDAGEAISKLTAGVKDMLVAGTEGFDFVSARRDKGRLKDILSRNYVSMTVKQSYVVQSLDEYLQKPNPSDEDWDEVAQKIKSTLKTLNEIFSDVKSENSNFVLDKSFKDLVTSLANRTSTLNKLSEISPPFSANERGLLFEISRAYKKLLSKAAVAHDELADYLSKNSKN
jgi:hypothetical protein